VQGCEFAVILMEVQSVICDHKTPPVDIQGRRKRTEEGWSIQQHPTLIQRNSLREIEREREGKSQRDGEGERGKRGEGKGGREHLLPFLQR